MPTKVHRVKAMVFPVIVCGCESWIINKVEHQRIRAFELWCWRRLQSSMDCSIPGFPVHPNSWSLLKLISIELVMPSNLLILWCPLLLLPSIFPRIRVFPNMSVLYIRWPKYWSFSFSTNPSNEYSGLISSRMDWLDILAVQGLSRAFPMPQFKSINSLALIFLYCPTLTSIHDYWKNHSFG